MKKQNKNKQFAVLGLGRFGFFLAEELSNKGYDVLVCDKDPVLVRQAGEFATDAVVADITDEEAINNLNLENYDTVIIAIGTSLESAIMATMFAKEKGVGCVITKALTFQQKKMFEKLGADRVVMPEYDSGKRLADQLINPNMLEFIKFSDNYAIAEIEPKPHWVNKSLKESNIRAKHELNVVALKRGTDVVINPGADEVIQNDDILVVIGENSKIQKY